MRAINISSIAKNTALLFASILIAFVIIEGGFRLTVPALNLQPNKGIAVADDNGYTVFQKNTDRYMESAELKRPVHIKTNGEGFIGHDYPLEKPSSTMRIAMLGDSFLDGTQIDYEKTFPHFLEEEFNKVKTDIKFEFMNFGVGGQGTVEEILRFYHYVAKYKPDYTILFFYPNDFENNQYYLDKRDLFTKKNPVWKDTKQTDANFKQERKDFKYKALKTLRSAQYLDLAVRRNALLSAIAVKLGLQSAGVMGAPKDGIHPSFFIYQDPLQESHKKVYDFTAELMAFLEDLTKEYQSQLIVVYIPEAAQVDDGMWAELQNTIPGLSKYRWNLFQPNQFLRERLSADLISYLDLTPIFKKFYRDNPGVYFYNQKGQFYNGHFNEQGHREVTMVLAQYLCQDQKIKTHCSSFGSFSE